MYIADKPGIMDKQAKDGIMTGLQFIFKYDRLEAGIMEYGYVRVSTKEQNIERQMTALKEFGIHRNNIFIDKQSGKNFERDNYKRLVKILTDNDILVIKSIDRLGRNYEEILEQWRILTKKKNVGVVVLDMPLLDTRQDKDLTGILIGDMVLQLLSYVAETERTFIRQRQAEGIAAAKAKGVKFGRMPMERPAEFENIKKAWKENKLSARKAAEYLNITHQTFLRWAREK